METSSDDQEYRGTRYPGTWDIAMVKIIEDIQGIVTKEFISASMELVFSRSSCDVDLLSGTFAIFRAVSVVHI
jgi:hypothetical protein